MLGLAIALASVCVCSAAHAERSCANDRPWSRLADSGSNLARPVPIALGALGALTPLGLAPTGLDHQLRLVAQRDLFGKPNLTPVSVWTPYVLAGGLLLGYGIATAADSCSGKRALSPIIGAGLLTFGGVLVLKLSVGRRFPNGGLDPNAADRLQHPERAHDFAPFQRAFAAWPSGHSALMFAGAAAFRASNPALGWASWLGYPLALGVAGGMWLGDHHWASDIVSGALFGEAIGGSFGQSFSDALGLPGALLVSPLAGSGFGAEWRAIW
jgi:membrane-associated phospholipid phosphatase